MHPNGQPHVAVVNGTSGLLSVLAFDGIRWSGVGGTPLFISNPRWSTASNPSIAISNAGQAYIAFTENENNNQLTVMTYTSSGGWTVVGERAISSESAFFINLAIHPLSNQPVVAYVGFQPHVLAFTGGRWTAMGSTPAEKVDNVNMLSFTPLLRSSVCSFCFYFGWARCLRCGIQRVQLDTGWCPNRTIQHPKYQPVPPSYYRISFRRRGICPI